MIAPRNKNVRGGTLTSCSTDPMTGFLRTGCCERDPSDQGAHFVCVRVTAQFLEFSKASGNDLSTPLPAYGFPGLKPGDQWCLCAPRWAEALAAGVAPQVDLDATEQSALEYVSLEDLERHSI